MFWTWQENSFPPGILFPVKLSPVRGQTEGILGFADFQNPYPVTSLSRKLLEDAFLRKQGESEDFGHGAQGRWWLEPEVWEPAQGREGSRVVDGQLPASGCLGRVCGFRELRMGLEISTLKTE